MNKEPMKMWVAREKDGSLRMFSDRPFINHMGVWTDGNINSSRLYSALFPEITYATGPQQVEIKVLEK